jgi:site-specific DNA-methyltransferase (adenine-specific)
MIDLINGDCLEEMKNIPDGSIDLVLTDPPYGTTACKWDTVIPFEPMWEQLKRIIKPNGVIVMTASQPFTTTLIASNMKMFKYCWVWDKVNASSGLHAKNQPLRSHEDICVFGSSRLNYYPQMATAKPREDKARAIPNGEAFNGKRVERIYSNGGLKYPKSILEVSNANQRGKQHPTQKPVALMEYLIKTYTNEGETVLDFTMGSGTTGVACKNLNRNFIGIELDKEYFEIAKKRIET